MVGACSLVLQLVHALVVILYNNSKRPYIEVPLHKTSSILAVCCTNSPLAQEHGGVAQPVERRLASFCNPILFIESSGGILKRN